MKMFQVGCLRWARDCFGERGATDPQERALRFLEEALELVQACGVGPGQAGLLLEYVYRRDKGDVKQEVGGVMVTLGVLAENRGIDIQLTGMTELNRCVINVDKIRLKHAAKPMIIRGV